MNHNVDMVYSMYCKQMRPWLDNMLHLCQNSGIGANNVWFTVRTTFPAVTSDMSEQTQA